MSAGKVPWTTADDRPAGGSCEARWFEYRAVGLHEGTPHECDLTQECPTCEADQAASDEWWLARQGRSA